MTQTGENKMIKDWNKYKENQEERDYIAEWNAQIEKEMDLKYWEIEKAKKVGNMNRVSRLQTEWNNLRDQEII